MSKKTLILGGIFIALLISAFAYDPILKWKDSLGKPVNFLAKANNFSEINKMEVKTDGVTVVLEKDDKGWRVAATKGFYVSEELVAAISTDLEEAAKGDLELVSTSKDRKTEFDTGENGTEVKLSKDGAVLADFVVGKPGSNFTSSYISKIDADETFLAASNLNAAFAHGEWYDKTIFSVDADKVAKIRFQYPTREFTIERKAPSDESAESLPGEWAGTLPYKFDVNQEKAKTVLDMMAKLSAAEIPTQKFEGTGLDKHSIIVQITGDGTDGTLMIGDAVENAEGDKNYYAKKGDSDNIYLISSDAKESLDKTINDLK